MLGRLRLGGGGGLRDKTKGEKDINGGGGGK